jgi:hypothetical protein
MPRLPGDLAAVNARWEEVGRPEEGWVFAAGSRAILQFALISWCERGDSNPHGLPRQILSLVRLPIPPLSRSESYTGRELRSRVPINFSHPKSRGGGMPVAMVHSCVCGGRRPGQAVACQRLCCCGGNLFTSGIRIVWRRVQLPEVRTRREGDGSRGQGRGPGSSSVNCRKEAGACKATVNVDKAVFLTRRR